MRPIHFGNSSRPLFGVYHPPQARRSPARSVVLCYPLVQEYLRAHWAFRKLASFLSRDGFHVLRFDYRATGDSWGDGSEACVADWLEDIRTAAGELRDLSGVRRPALVGLRLGATMALLAARDGLPVSEVVLWEPVASGKDHLAELREIERVKYGNLPHPPVPGPDELLESPLPPRLRAEVEAMDVTAGIQVRADRLLLFAGSPRPEHEAFVRGVRDRAGHPPRISIVPEDAVDHHDGVLLSTRVLHAITSALGGGES